MVLAVVVALPSRLLKFPINDLKHVGRKRGATNSLNKNVAENLTCSISIV